MKIQGEESIKEKEVRNSGKGCKEVKKNKDSEKAILINN